MSVRALLRCLVLAVGATAGLALLWYLRRAQPQPTEATALAPPSDPRVAAVAEWPNVHPDVPYTGDESCAGCHASITRSFRRHPMGRAFSTVAGGPRPEKFDAAARDPFEAGGLRYRAERRGEAVVHQEAAVDAQGRVVAELTTEVQYVIGSGQRGLAYLVDRDGCLFQSPLTWYPQKGIWDLAPGYERQNLHFTRLVVPACLFCHVRSAEPVADTMNRFRPPIFRGHSVGCERCHGPGDLHVKARRADPGVEGVDRTIVNPRHLAHDLREAVCEQCHLQGRERVARRGRGDFDYRPGLPLEAFLVDFVKPPEDSTETRFVGTVEQMHVSRCYRESRGEGKLGCISCHDPHALPAREERVAYYRERCLSCHATRGCALPVAVRREQNPEDSCIACHMPATGSDANHTSISDHRIPRRPDPRPASASTWPRPGQVPLVPFHPTRPDRDEAERDLAIALMTLADRVPDQMNRWLAGETLPALEAAVARHPEDLAARDAEGDALWSQGRLPDALAAYEGTLEQAPRREYTLYRLTALALRQKQFERAGEYARRALEVNPWRWQTHMDLATALAQVRDWAGAAAACRKAIALQPFRVASRGLLVNCLLQQGDKAAARAEFEVVVALSPAEKREALRAWFARQSP